MQTRVQHSKQQVHKLENRSSEPAGRQHHWHVDVLIIQPLHCSRSHAERTGSTAVQSAPA